MSEWQHGRRQCGPHCKGMSWQHIGSASWDLRFLQFIHEDVPGKTMRWSHIELAASGLYEADESAAQAACDAQVAEWEERFPMLEIVAPTEAQEEVT